MKRCPECRRDYYDDSLGYCLDDGAILVEGPASDGADTAILPSQRSPLEKATQLFEPGEDPAGFRRSPDKRLVYLWIIIPAALLIGVGSYFYFGRSSDKQIGSIAVMPFANESGDADLEYLSDGVTESLINSLSRIPKLSVKARSSVFSYKGKNVSPEKVASDLAVQAVLNGRITQRGNQVLFSAELIDGRTGDQLWGNQYARQMTDLARLQTDLARDVSFELRSKLTGPEQQRVIKNYTENGEAYQLFLRGRYHWNKRKREDFNKSIEYFQQAIRKDPMFALAYAGLADVYVLMPGYRFGTPQEFFPKARAAAEKAIEIDPELAEAHNALASVMSNFEWRFDDAEDEWKKTLDLNPNYATGRQWYAEYLLAMGRHKDALEEMKRAQELDPLSLIINGLVGVLLRVNGQDEAALEQLRSTLEMDPNFPTTHVFIAETYERMGKYDEAVDEFARSFELNGAPPEPVAEFKVRVKTALKNGGQRGYSRAIAELLEGHFADPPPPQVVIAAYWVNAGEIDKAFALLNKAYDEHSDGMLLLKDGHLHAVESDPRFLDLVRRVGLPE